MSATPDDSHDPALLSWVESANDPACDFPVQNLPLGRFRTGPHEHWTIGVAIGDALLDLRRAGLTESDDMNALMTAGTAARRALRRELSQGLRRGSGREPVWRRAIVPMRDVELSVPCRIGDYTDFYTSIHHATAVGKQFRPDAPLLPNYKWVPIGYHGRSSSISVSKPGLGHGFRRPVGQIMPPGAVAPMVQASSKLDY